MNDGNKEDKVWFGKWEGKRERERESKRVREQESKRARERESERERERARESERERAGESARAHTLGFRSLTDFLSFDVSMRYLGSKTILWSSFSHVEKAET